MKARLAAAEAQDAQHAEEIAAEREKADKAFAEASLSSDMLGPGRAMSRAETSPEPVGTWDYAEAISAKVSH